MKFTCTTDTLREAITNVQRAVASKATLPALEGILIASDGEKIILSGYDLEIAIKTTVEANVTEEGCAVVNARLLGDMIRKAQTETVFVEVDEKMVMTVKSGACAFNIMTIDANEYPELPPINEAENIDINAGLFRSMVSETVFSASQSEDKPVHTGVLFEIDEDNIRLVAVDSSRFAIRNEFIAGVKKMRFIIPSKTLGEILKLIGDDEDNIKINVGQRHASFNVGDFLVITRMLEGDFLDYNSAIPKTSTTDVIIDTHEFISSIDRMSLLITERIVSPVRCIFENNEVKLNCATALGKASDTVDCETDGNALEIGFNNRYMLEALRAIKDNKVKISFGGAQQPIKITPVDGEKYLYLIMPIRLRNSDV